MTFIPVNFNGHILALNSFRFTAASNGTVEMMQDLDAPSPAVLHCTISSSGGNAYGSLGGRLAAGGQNADLTTERITAAHFKLVSKSSGVLPIMFVADDINGKTLAILDNLTLRLYDTSADQFGSEIIGTSTASVPEDEWFHVAVDWTDGAIRVWLNGELVITSSASWETDLVYDCAFGPQNSSIGATPICEVFVSVACVGSGSPPSPRTRVASLFPSNETANRDYAANTGDPWDAIAEFSPNGDTTYVSRTGTGTSYYVMTAPPSDMETVYGTITNAIQRREGATAISGQVLHRVGLSIANTTAANYGTAYANFAMVRALAPDSSAWNETNLNALEAGFTNGGSGQHRVTALRVGVLYVEAVEPPPSATMPCIVNEGSTLGGFKPIFRFRLAEGVELSPIQVESGVLTIRFTFPETDTGTFTLSDYDTVNDLAVAIIAWAGGRMTDFAIGSAYDPEDLPDELIPEYLDETVYSNGFNVYILGDQECTPGGSGGSVALILDII